MAHDSAQTRSPGRRQVQQASARVWHSVLVLGEGVFGYCAKGWGTRLMLVVTLFRVGHVHRARGAPCSPWRGSLGSWWIKLALVVLVGNLTGNVSRGTVLSARALALRARGGLILDHSRRVPQSARSRQAVTLVVLGDNLFPNKGAPGLKGVECVSNTAGRG